MYKDTLEEQQEDLAVFYDYDQYTKIDPELKPPPVKEEDKKKLEYRLCTH